MERKKYIDKVIFIILFAINLNCLYANGVQKLKNKDTTYVCTKKYEGIIWSKNYPINVKDNKVFRWNPDIKDIEIAELLMEEYLNIMADSILVNQDGICPIVHLNLNKYIRQYMGVINQSGDRILKINCFWKDDEYIKRHPCWRTNLIDVSDGCSFYWSIKVNIQKKECFDYYINGE